MAQLSSIHTANRRSVGDFHDAFTRDDYRLLPEITAPAVAAVHKVAEITVYC